MNSKLKIISLPIIFLILFSFSLIYVACSDDKNDDKAEVVGCNEVKYKGFTYSINGCSSGGVASFDTEITQSGHTAAFHITCSNGCIQSASVIKGGLNKAITSP